MSKPKSMLFIGGAAIVAGLMMLAVSFAAGTPTTHGQATGTATSAATTAAGSPTTTAGGTSTSVAGSPIAARTATTTAAAGGAQSLPSTGTGLTAGSRPTGLIWLAVAAMVVAVAGGTLAYTGSRRRS